MLALGVVVWGGAASALPTTPLGAAFTAHPHALPGDVLLESDDAWNALRDLAGAESSWLGWHDAAAGGGLWRRLLVDGALVAALRDEPAGGVQFVDFSDPTQPGDRGELAGSVYTDGLLRDGLLYLTLTSLLVVYDVTDPASPVFRFAWPLAEHQGPRWFDAAGDLVAFREAGVTAVLLDVSDPLAITVAGTVDLPADRVDALAASPGALHALLATEIAPGTWRIDLATFDLTDPAAPVECDRRQLAAGPGARGLTLARRDQLLLAAENQAATHAFDVTTPTSPQAGFSLPVCAEALAVTATRLVTFTGDALRVHERTEPHQQPDLLAVRSVPPQPRRLFGSGPHLLAQSAKDPSLVLVIAVDQPTRPCVTVELDCNLDGVLVHRDGVAAMILEDDAQVIDLADPAAPVLRGVVRTSEPVDGSASVLADGSLVCGTSGGDVLLIDLADLDQPAQAGRLIAAGRPLAAGRRTLITSRDHRFAIHDVSDPAHPADLGPLPVDAAAVAAAVAGPRAYCLTASGGAYTLHVVDVADPAQAAVLTTAPVDPATALAVHGQRLYATGTDGIQVIDLTATPTITARCTPNFTATNLLGTHDDVIVTGRHLETFRDHTWQPVAVPTTPPMPARLTVHPNPFNPRTTIALELSRTHHLTITVHDLRGRTLATLANRPFPPGPHALTWSPTPSTPSGTYLIRAHAPGLEYTCTATLIK